MLIRRTMLMSATCFAAASLSAQQPPAPTESPGGPAPQVRRRRPEVQFDAAAVARGRDLLVARCGFCHGSNGRGGAAGPDLTRSALVQEDENGRQLGEFLRVGRPERNMPKFELGDQELKDLATFLHSSIYHAANRGLYQILDIVVGDAEAGKAFFEGAGRCVSCHSTEGDLRGVGARHEPAALQGRILMPRGGRGFGPGGPGGPPGAGGRGAAPSDASAVKATVTLASGESFTGALIRLTDFDVSILDAASHQRRSWLRNEGVPSVTLEDPLQAHIDRWRTWTDDDLHDVTAYLAGLK